jgi:hypothetical protein
MSSNRTEAMYASRTRSFALSLALCGLIAGCGDDPGADPVQQGAAAHEADARTAAATAEATKGMVAGVTNASKPGAPVDLKFKIGERPAVGKPLSIEVAFVPRVATDHLRATFIATDGLQVQPSDVPASFEKAQPASVYRYTLTVVPRDEGVYYVSAIVLMDLSSGAEARTFNIPVLVGIPDESAETAQKSPPPQIDGTGQPVQPVPAQQN